jgi:hypothetical protein
MRKLVVTLIGTAWLGLGWWGCGQPVAVPCNRLTGVFHGQYRLQSGSCEQTFQGRALYLEKNATGTTIRRDINLAESVETEVTLIGCQIAVRQEISEPMGLTKISEVRGELNIDQDQTLYGELTRTEYMPDGTTPRCTGQYEAYFTSENAVIGSAAESALRDGP